MDGLEIAPLARRWIGTPYVHQASTIGQGTDCLGLIRGLWRELYGKEPAGLPNYSPDWSESSGREELLDAAKKHLLQVCLDINAPGQVLLFRMRSQSVAKHLGITCGEVDGFARVIHAYSGHGVIESALTPAWQRRIIAQFEFPSRST